MKKKNVIVITVAAVLAVIALAVGCYMFCLQDVKTTDEWGLDTYKPFYDVAPVYALVPIYVIIAIIAAFIDELIHEGAHLMMGTFCSMGMKVPKIRIFRSSSIEMYPYGTKRMKARMILTTGAGLFFDFILVVLGVLSIAIPSVPVALAIALPYALYSLIINAAPLEYESGKTDGLVLCELITNKPTAEVLLAILKIQGAIHDGALINELEPEMFLDVPQLPEDDLNFIIMTQLRYEYYLAKGNDSEAYKYFCRYRDLIQYLPEGYTKKDKKQRKIDAMAASIREKDEKAAEDAELKPEDLREPEIAETVEEENTEEAENTAEEVPEQEQKKEDK